MFEYSTSRNMTVSVIKLDVRRKVFLNMVEEATPSNRAVRGQLPSPL